MAIVSITNHLVCPTENDINGGTTGAGIIPTEDTLGKLWRNPGGLPGYVISGWTMPATGAGLTKTCTGGSACIDGYVITGSGTYSFTFDASVTNHLWLQLVYVSGKVTGVQVQSFSSASTYAANAIYLGSVTCNATDVTSVTNRQTQNRTIFGRCGGGASTIVDAGTSFWSINRTATGAYTLTFGAGVFSRTPCVVASAVQNQIKVTPASATSCTFTTHDSGGAATDSEFSFMAFI